MSGKILYKNIIKRILDLVISVLLISILFPVLIIISILIKVTSNGPIFFKQKRIGKNGCTFHIYKFRTMCVGAENIGDGLSVKSSSDSRITSIGRILRKTSIDEIPQLWNIIKGDMSLIGPRPPVTYFPYKGYANYPSWAKKRFTVRPGVTGLSQCTVRNSVVWDKRIDIDNIYVEKISFLLDLKILFLTILRTLKQTDIYGGGKLYKNE